MITEDDIKRTAEEMAAQKERERLHYIGLGTRKDDYTLHPVDKGIHQGPDGKPGHPYEREVRSNPNDQQSSKF